jgi:hypothetical protein
MYIEPTRRYYKGTEQCIAQARFLLLVQPEGYEHRNEPIRALVRKVALHQCGHFMMGKARTFGHSITVSGSYGGDGLPCNVPMEVYEKAVDVPQELIEAWDKGGGWNSCGSEAPLMRDWALKTFKEKT